MGSGHFGEGAAQHLTPFPQVLSPPLCTRWKVVSCVSLATGPWTCDPGLANQMCPLSGLPSGRDRAV